VNFNGEHRGKSQKNADDGVDIPTSTPLETLCNRTVSARARPAEGSAIVDIPRHQRIGTLCIPMVSVTAISR